MTARPNFVLVDVPLTAKPADNGALILKMAVDLRRLGVTGNERDAIRALTSCGYRMGDVALLAEDALFAARHGIVSREMER